MCGKQLTKILFRVNSIHSLPFLPLSCTLFFSTHSLQSSPRNKQGMFVPSILPTNIQNTKRMFRCLLFIALLIYSTSAQKPPENPSNAQKPPENPGNAQKLPQPAPKKWPTLSGQQPLVVARGGFSGLFPESSSMANQNALATSLPDVVLSCNLQMTKDGIGVCLSDVKLDNTTTISDIYPKDQKTYLLNGQNVNGWFALDFTIDQLLNKVTLTQNIFSRTNLFDGQFPISTVEDATGIKPPQFWLNVQYDSFYNEHKISPGLYLEKALRHMIINYISSPEIGFLKFMTGKIDRMKTKLIFVFLDPNDVEPTTKQKYSELMGNLAMIKTFASGIVVPKQYILPTNPNGYLGVPTNLVADAHKQGLQIYASGFANDAPGSYNYSYDPTAEYAKFVDNSQFSVDGVITDFPPTASEAIACFSNNSDRKHVKGKTLIISNNGASGTYPGCTDLAYQKAVDDGTDIIDCSVQMSKDGVAFCLASADLAGDTTAMMPFIDRKANIPEIQPEAGVFSFSLSWSEIQSLKPQMTSPFMNNSMLRNPESKNAGKFVTLAEFLEFAKAKAVTGILINIENAAYLASKQGLDIVDAVNKALNNATYDKQSNQELMVQSDDTSVLLKFKQVPTYKRVLKIKEKIGGVPKPAVDEIKKYADAVTVPRASLVRVSNSFTIGSTEVVKEMHAANISVYVYQFRNEYVTLAFDYFSDPVVEIATFVQTVGVDGIITDYPGTASKYLRSPCTDTDPKAQVPYPILPAEPGALLSIVPPQIQPPAQAPGAALQIQDVVHPPLPPVVSKPNDAPSPPAHETPKSSGYTNVANMGISLIAMLVFGLLSMGC